MALQLIKKIATKLLGRSTTTQLSERPAKGGTRSRPSDKRKDEPARRGKGAAARPARNKRPARPVRPERPERPEQSKSEPRADAPSRPPRKRSDARTSERPPRRADSQRPQRRTDSQRPSRSGSTAPRSGYSDRSTTRPGGAVGAPETAHRQEVHATWSPEQFQVPPAEGKKRFQDFDLPAEILHAVADLKFEYCTPIQALSLEYALAGKNVAGRAQTGTGKTAAFLVALLTRYLRTPTARPTEPGCPRALIIAPTRELVIQISDDADAIGKYCGLRYLAVYGGMDHERQRQELQAGPVDLLVATPGRLLDFVNGKVIDLSQVDTLVIDEADRMLDMGFIPDVKRIIFRLPPKEKRSTMLYSATLNDDVMRLASQWMTEPVRVDIDSGTLTIDTVRQVIYIVTAREKFKILFNLLQEHPDQRVLVFCNRRRSTERVAENLTRLGIRCEMLSGDVQQNRRLRVLEDFKAGNVRVVVATDVAGRGLHVDDIGFVVNFDFPYEADDYVHRIGRTGRAGHTGTAISFADEDESFIIPDIEKFIGEPLKCTVPEENLLRPIPSGRGRSRPPQQREPSPRDSRQEDASSPRDSRQEDAPSSRDSRQDVSAPAAKTASTEVKKAASTEVKKTVPDEAKKVEKVKPKKAAPTAIHTTTKRPVAEEWSPGQS